MNPTYIYPLFKGTQLVGIFGTEELGRAILNGMVVLDDCEYQLEEHTLNVLSNKFNVRVVAAK